LIILSTKAQAIGGVDPSQSLRFYSKVAQINIISSKKSGKAFVEI
jgi:hypothetical protein